MFTFKYNIYCEKKVRNKFKVDKIILNNQNNIVNIDYLMMTPLQIFKLINYIKLNDLTFI